jgi:ribosomal protein S18 acetylase RimI-like enzyme
MIEIKPTRDASMLACLNETAQNLHAALHPSIFKKYERNSVTLALADMLNSAHCEAFVAKMNGIAAGYMLVLWRNVEENAFHNAYSTLHIDQIAVLEEFRGKGVGSALMHFAEGRAKNKGVFKIELDHWTNNEKAAFFFRKNGYELVKERRMKILD